MQESGSEATVLSPDAIQRAARVVAATPSSALHLRELFISWHGVATVAFHGFSRALLDLKERLSSGGLNLAPENPGSRWPKCTLGCVRDGVELQREQVQTLRRLCDAANRELLAAPPVVVSALALVVFDCRSLERIEMRQHIDLVGAVTDDGPPPAAHLSDVDRTMSEFSWQRLDAYLPRLQQEGGRESHYRQAHRESTLVLEITQLPRCVETFQRSVDAQLDGVYRWFEPTSLHVTVRALVPRYDAERTAIRV